MLSVCTSLAIGERLQIGEATITPVRVSGNRVRLEIRVPPGCRVCKPELEAQIIKDMEHLRDFDEGVAG